MADTGNDALDAITRRQNLAIDSTVAWFERELRVLLNRSQMQLTAELLAKLEVVEGRIAPTAANQKVLREISDRFEALLKKQGVEELYEELTSSFGGQFEYFEETLRVLGEKPVKFPKADLDWFAQQQAGTVDVLEGILRNTADLARRQALLRVGGLTPESLAELIASETGKSIGQATAVADTAQSTFYRSIAERGFQRIEDSQPGSMPLRYAYYGPDDKLNRPFCRRLLEQQQPAADGSQGRTWTRAEIEAMNNGQLPNPFLTGGGYRCRHQWIVARAIAPRRAAAAEAAAAKITDPEAEVRVGRLDRAIVKQFAPRNPDATLVMTQGLLDKFSDRPGAEDLFGGRQVLQAVLDPEMVYRSRKDADTAEFYRRLDDSHMLKTLVKFAGRKGRGKHTIIDAVAVPDRKFRRPSRRYLAWQREDE